MNTLDRNVLKIEKHNDHHRLRLMLPGGTGNYLHTDLKMSVNDAIIVRTLLLDQEFYDQDVTLSEEDGYYRMNLVVKDVNGTSYFFHGRKVNLNDAIYERDELLA